MTKTMPILAAIACLALSGCGSTKTEEAGAYNAAEIAATPFTIGNTTADEMGAPPVGEMGRPEANPYALDEEIRAEASVDQGVSPPPNPSEGNRI